LRATRWRRLLRRPRGRDGNSARARAPSAACIFPLHRRRAPVRVRGSRAVEWVSVRIRHESSPSAAASAARCIAARESRSARPCRAKSRQENLRVHELFRPCLERHYESRDGVDSSDIHVGATMTAVHARPLGSAHFSPSSKSSPCPSPQQCPCRAEAGKGTDAMTSPFRASCEHASRATRSSTPPTPTWARRWLKLLRTRQWQLPGRAGRGSWRARSVDETGTLSRDFSQEVWEWERAAVRAPSATGRGWSLGARCEEHASRWRRPL
jgi:hypothetical protein